MEGFLLSGHSGDKGGPEIANTSQVGCPAVLFSPTPARMVPLCLQELTLLSPKGLFPGFLPPPCPVSDPSSTAPRSQPPLPSHPAPVGASNPHGQH